MARADDLATNIKSPSTENRLLEVADACFEMFSIRELKNANEILPELTAAFPECSTTELMEALALALSWKRLLRTAGRTVH